MVKPDGKLALKSKLYDDQAKLIEKVNNEKNPVLKTLFQEQLNLVNSYIVICKKRNKF